MPDARVSLLLGGQAYSGWTAVRVRRSIETACGSFELEVSERFPANPAGRRIRAGEACAVRIGSETLITGYVDAVEVGLGPEAHSIVVRGRDKVGDLVDCTPDVSPGEWLSVDLLELAQTLAEPFGISVRAEAPIGDPFPKVALNPGQRAWELIEERARYRQVLPVSDGRGGLVFTRAGAARSPVALIEGQNILTAQGSDEHSERFSDYIVKGQSPGGDGIDLGTSASPQGKASDAEISRHRPLVVIASSAVDLDRCEQRAKWEAIVRAARGRRARITVQGWQQPGGALWPLNALVSVQSPTLGLRGSLLISEVSYALDGSGRRTELNLVRPDAFTAMPGGEVPEESFGIV